MLTKSQFLLVFTNLYEHLRQNKYTILQFGTIVVPNIVDTNLSFNILKATQFFQDALQVMLTLFIGQRVLIFFN